MARRSPPPAPPATDLAEVLLADALARIRDRGEALPPPLDAAWRALFDAWSERAGHDFVAQFVGPTGTPAFPLLAGIAEDLGLADGEPVRRAGEGLMAWYFALRCQDDVVDEGGDAALVYLGQALEALALRALAAASGDPEAMIDAWVPLIRDFAAYALLDDRARRPGDEGDEPFVWDDASVAGQGRKYLPMVGPPVALLLRAGRADAIPALRDAVERLATGLQLTNDLYGAAHDLDRGLGSPLLATVGLRAGVDAAEDLDVAIRRAVRTRRWDRYTGWIERSLRDGAAAFDGLPGAARIQAHVELRLEALTHAWARHVFDGAFSAPRLSLDLELTRRCSLRCPHCFVRVQQPTGDPEELPAALAREVIAEAAGYATDLHVTGGEPFEHPDVWSLLEYAAGLGIERVGINTHGGALDDDALARLGALPTAVRLMVSLDGPPGRHDATRGPDAEANALRVLRRAPGEGLAAIPGSVLTAELVSYGIGRWAAWLRERIGERRLALWPLFLRPGVPAGDGVGHPLDADALVDAAIQLAALHNDGTDVVVADYPVINPLLQRLGVPADALWQCTGGRSRLCVHADGMVSPCHPLRWDLERLVAGRVTGFVRRSLAHPDARRMAARDADRCAPCPEKSICGGCRATVFGQGFPPFADDGLCATALDRLSRHGAI